MREKINENQKKILGLPPCTGNLHKILQETTQVKNVKAKYRVPMFHDTRNVILKVVFRAFLTRTLAAWLSTSSRAKYQPVNPVPDRPSPANRRTTTFVSPQLPPTSRRRVTSCRRPRPRISKKLFDLRCLVCFSPFL